MIGTVDHRTPEGLRRSVNRLADWAKEDNTLLSKRNLLKQYDDFIAMVAKLDTTTILEGPLVDAVKLAKACLAETDICAAAHVCCLSL